MMNNEWIDFFNNDNNVIPINQGFVILDDPYYTKAKLNSYSCCFINSGCYNLSVELNEFISFWHNRFNITNNITA